MNTYSNGMKINILPPWGKVELELLYKHFAPLGQSSGKSLYATKYAPAEHHVYKRYKL